MSKLYLVRHGIAEEAKAAQADADRALTAEGIRKFRKAAAGIVRILREEPPELLLTSPYVRARQTADILREAFDHDRIKTELQVCDPLLEDGGLTQFLRVIKGRAALGIGHEPILSHWIGKLCFKTAGQLDMKKGALAALEVRTAMTAELLYLLPPGILRDL